MEPSRSVEEAGHIAPTAEPTDEDRGWMLRASLASMTHGLTAGGPLLPRPDEIPQSLRASRGAFVTLEVSGTLNGCIGNLSPETPLGLLVPQLAWSAAFDDPRLPRLTSDDLPRLHVEISLLSALEPIPAASPQELLSHVQAGVHGVFVEAGPFSATLLPAVWEHVPAPCDFLAILMHKSGAPAGFWPRDLRAFRYTSVSFGAMASELA
jgi:AmmeMemoRadiSam system protein A